MINKVQLYKALRQMGKDHLQEPYKSRWTPQEPTTGYCYPVSEVIYHYLAPEGSKPYVLRDEDNETHWFIKGPNGEIIDDTADQYTERPKYEEARPHAFQTRKISKRGEILAKLLGLV